MPRFDADRRRARLALRHRLAPSAAVDDPVEATDALVGLHATDPATVYLAARARLRHRDGAIDEVAAALYEARTLVRLLGMRRTMWVVSTGLAPTVLAGASRSIAVTQRTRLVKELIGSHVPESLNASEEPEATSEAVLPLLAIVDPTDPAAWSAWLARLEDRVTSTLKERGTATGAELAEAEPGLRTQLTYAEDKAYGGPINITSRVLNLMSMDGRIVRGRPRGTWISRQHLWAPLSAWLPDDWDTVAPSEEAARVEIIRRWLGAFGPGTVADIKWWTGWTIAVVRRALTELGATEVDLDDGETGYVLPADLPVDSSEPGPVEPWVALLPALDPTTMGWRGRDWYLPPAYRPRLFDTNGNAGPTVWSNGRVVGGWGQRKGDGRVVYRLFEDIGAEATEMVDAEVAGLTAWLGDVRVTPSFRTPTERELADALPG